MSAGLEGDAKVLANLGKLEAQFAQRAAKGVYAVALRVTSASMKRTPVDTGALRASHETGKPEVNARGSEVKITVGGPAAPYAVIVHEDLGARHPVGEAKFLERSVLEAVDTFAADVAAAMGIGG